MDPENVLIENPSKTTRKNGGKNNSKRSSSQRRVNGDRDDQLKQLLSALRMARDGDFSVRLAFNQDRLLSEIADVFNEYVSRNQKRVRELARVSRVIGEEGKLTERAELMGASGEWKTSVEAVNALINNLAQPTNEVGRVITAVARGDLNEKMRLEIDGRPLKGEFLQIGTIVNTMVDQLSSFAGEVTRVAREVGTEGELGGQAEVRGVAGTWKGLTDNVNAMANSLTSQVRNIAEVTTAVAQGDLSRKITVQAKGEILQLKNTINTMVDQLNGFASEVIRVAREVGTEGKLGGQAKVEGVAGTWKDLTNNVNWMADNLTSQVRNIAEVTKAVALGDLSKKITVEVRGEILELKDTINTMVDQLNAFASEVSRVAKEVGTDGKLGGQAEVRGVSGIWKDLTDNVNRMASNLTDQVRNIALVTTGVANGDLSQKITVDASGEIMQLKDTINRMVDQLNSFASEVSRVAKEVGTDGKLGGQAQIKGVAGTWKDLTDNVNRMATNLTDQVRNIALVTTSVAQGDLSKKITVEAKGEILELKSTINTMVDQLNAFAAEVTRVAREVGTEGMLGGQARVLGIAGTWKDLTDNVNQLAANLTTQVRAIADVATAVTRGDLTRSIAVEAQGEVEELKNNINQMIITLKETTQKNIEQDWLKTNLAKFSRMLQGQRDLQTVAQNIMSELTPLVSAQHGVFYVKDSEGGQPVLKLLSSYGYKKRKAVSNRFQIGEGLVGQCALERKPIIITNVPEDYIKISSGLGESRPRNIIVLPVLFEGQVMGVTEIASFEEFSQIHQLFLEQLMESLGVVLNMIGASMRTEELLKQSQALATELQSQQQELKRSNEELEEQTQALKTSQEMLKQQQEELQRTNDDLEEKAFLLSEQKKMVEMKNRELELAQASLEERAEQLAITSKYKSEFMANMSHELRTPLNSILLLAKLLSENKETNLTEKQVDYLQTVYASGNDLLGLINEVLDLSKIEAGKMDIHAQEFPVSDVKAFAERSFRQIAEQKGLEFKVDIESDVPQIIKTDPHRLEQVLRNLLSNAFKFTDSGSVQIQIFRANPEQRFIDSSLNLAENVIGLAVQDTGIGIPKEKQRIVFEAFQQADGGTNRRHGGTGLGLTISREIIRLLGGEIHLESNAGEGSKFFIYLPQSFTPAETNYEFQIPGVTGPAGPVSPLEGIEKGSDAAAFSKDDRYDIQPGDRVVLIVEDDEKFAEILSDIAHEKGFKVLTAGKGDTGLALAHEFVPSAILLDISLPVMSGWTLLDRIKHHPRTRHIPVHVVSVLEERNRALQQGAIAYLVKPVTAEALDDAFGKIVSFINRGIKYLLVVEYDPAQQKAIVELIGNGDLEITAVATGAEALAEIWEKRYDCMVLDLSLPDMDGFQLIEEIKSKTNEIPIIVYTGKELTEKEETQLKRFAETIVIKGVSSPECLLDETALFLHRVEAKLPEEKGAVLKQLHNLDMVFAGKKILIVDDDVRNIFALTSVLESNVPVNQKMKILFAETGREGIQILEENQDVDLVLMDIMMPDLDGYQAMQHLRSDNRFKSLPIIALTAKAMKGDREKCIEAGASDYISKPVDIEQLLSLMRVWLYQ